MILVVQLFKEAGGEGTGALEVDNQVIIRSIDTFQSKTRHFLVNKFYNNLKNLLLEENRRKLVIRWTPGHKGIAGIRLPMNKKK
jgi:hypothetical protein